MKRNVSCLPRIMTKPLPPKMLAHHNRTTLIALFERVYTYICFVCVWLCDIIKYLCKQNGYLTITKVPTHIHNSIKPIYTSSLVCIVVAQSETCHFTLKHTSTHQTEPSQRWRKRSVNLIKIYLRYFINIYENFTFPYIHKPFVPLFQRPSIYINSMRNIRTPVHALSVGG